MDTKLKEQYELRIQKLRAALEECDIYAKDALEIRSTRYVLGHLARTIEEDDRLANEQ